MPKPFGMNSSLMPSPFGVKALGINAIEKDISPKSFFRINRGQIINIKAVKKIHPYLNHRLKLEIEMNKNLEFIVSRKRTSEFKQWVDQ